MKLKARLFILFLLLIMAIIPVINYKAHSASKKEWRQWFDKTALYNLDFALPYFNILAYQLGISSTPMQVIIGKNNWLFIGDKYSNSLSSLRSGASKDDEAAATKIDITSKSWLQWYKTNNIKIYQILVIADKQTLYKEFLPDWIRREHKSMTDFIFQKVDPGIFLDSRPILKEAKSLHSNFLFYKTDSHWNPLGAWVAYEYLSNELKIIDTNMQWLVSKNARHENMAIKFSGDLANFLSLKKYIYEEPINFTLDKPYVTSVSKYDVSTGIKLPYSDAIKFRQSIPPLLIHSKSSLNNKKILFLGDSFSDNLSPYITATFRETLQIHYGTLSAATLALAVQSFKPDYVLHAVIERDLQSNIFKELPPLPVKFDDAKYFKASTKLNLVGLNDITKSEKLNTYHISGNDPFIHFTLSPRVKLKDSPKFLLELICNDTNKHIPTQLFIETNSFGFSEENSRRSNLKSGISIIDISTLTDTSSQDLVYAFRLDLDPLDKSCNQFTLSRFEMGND